MSLWAATRSVWTDLSWSLQQNQTSACFSELIRHDVLPKSVLPICQSFGSLKLSRGDKAIVSNSDKEKQNITLTSYMGRRISVLFLRQKRNGYLGNATIWNTCICWLPFGCEVKVSKDQNNTFLPCFFFQRFPNHTTAKSYQCAKMTWILTFWIYSWNFMYTNMLVASVYLYEYSFSIITFEAPVFK